MIERDDDGFRCETCGSPTAHVMADGVLEVLCPHCDPDSLGEVHDELADLEAGAGYAVHMPKERHDYHRKGLRELRDKLDGWEDDLDSPSELVRMLAVYKLRRLFAAFTENEKESFPQDSWMWHAERERVALSAKPIVTPLAERERVAQSAKPIVTPNLHLAMLVALLRFADRDEVAPVVEALLRKRLGRARDGDLEIVAKAPKHVRQHAEAEAQREELVEWLRSCGRDGGWQPASGVELGEQFFRIARPSRNRAILRRVEELLSKVDTSRLRGVLETMRRRDGRPRKGSPAVASVADQLADFCVAVGLARLGSKRIEQLLGEARNLRGSSPLAKHPNRRKRESGS